MGPLGRAADDCQMEQNFSFVLSQARMMLFSPSSIEMEGISNGGVCVCERNLLQQKQE